MDYCIIFFRKPKKFGSGLVRQNLPSDSPFAARVSISLNLLTRLFALHSLRAESTSKPKKKIQIFSVKNRFLHKLKKKNNEMK